VIGEQKPGVWLTLLVLVGAYFAVTAWNLHLQTIVNPDEPRYACPAREMLRGGDWVVPEFNARPRLLKPIGFYWLIAATGAAGQAVGLGLAAALRLGPLLMGWLAVVATLLLGRRLAGAWCGVIAAVVLMTTWFFHQCSRELVVDMTLTAFITWSWLFCHIALERIRTVREAKSQEPRAKSFLPLLAFYLCLGLACMTKGPVLVALFVVVPLVIYLAWSRRLSDLRRAGLWWGAPLALAVGCWWFVVLWQRGYTQEVKAFFFTENVARAVGGKDHQRYIPFLFYLLDLGQNFAPWVILLPFAAWWSLQQWRSARAAETRNPKPETRLFLCCALGVPFVILGLVFSKRALYLLPLYPLLALWVGWMTHDFVCRAGSELAWWRARTAVGSVLLTLAVAAGVATAAGGFLGAPVQLWLLVAFLLAATYWGLRIAPSDRVATVGQALMLALALCIGYETVARPITEWTANRAAFYCEVNERLAGKPVVLLGLSSNEAVWYLDRPKEPLDDLRFPELKARFFDAPGTKLLVSQRILDKDAELKKALVLEPLSVTREGERFFLADPDPAHPPAPEIFKPVKERQQRVEGDE